MTKTSVINFATQKFFKSEFADLAGAMFLKFSSEWVQSLPLNKAYCKSSVQLQMMYAEQCIKQNKRIIIKTKF